jgi:hypothetical protein
MNALTPAIKKDLEVRIPSTARVSMFFVRFAGARSRPMLSHAK